MRRCESSALSECVESENTLELVKPPKCTFILNSEKIRLSKDCKAGRSRTTYTARQVDAMQATFEKDMDPSMEKIEEVAKAIKLTEQQVCSSIQMYRLNYKGKLNRRKK